jgi:hypothetical protein
MGLGNPALFDGDVEIDTQENCLISQIEVFDSPNHDGFHFWTKVFRRFA